ncbi:AAA family ATPase [Lactiplantibacillus argentoratensis]|uniref:AAA family ATPase n=1 Tax=Lactiplantibacillus argentoratensis TaxID=271881 RepID=UPI003EBA6CF4
MNYFGPHEHSIIDFSKLESTPIFLISGDTGAGKSTIFDAMTFALFGRRRMMGRMVGQPKRCAASLPPPTNRQASPSTLSKAINSIRLRAPLSNT